MGINTLKPTPSATVYVDPLLEMPTASASELNCHCLIAGGGAPETEVAFRLMEYSQTLTGMEAYCIRAFSEAMEVIPFTLAENAGLNPIGVVTELRKRHALGERAAGINVRKVHIHVCNTLWSP